MLYYTVFKQKQAGERKMGIFSELGLCSLLAQNFSLWASVYVIYTLIAAVPLLPFFLPFPEDLKRTAKGKVGIFGMYLFFFFIIVFLTIGPTIIQTYLLRLTINVLVYSLGFHIFFGALLFHALPYLSRRGTVALTKSNTAGTAIAILIFYLIMIPIYYHLVWRLVQLSFS